MSASNPGSWERARAWIEVDLEALRANVGLLLSSLPASTSLMAVVKADAYGHGLVHVARNALLAGATWLGIATVDEGARLRRAGIDSPIALLCSPTARDAGDVVDLGLTAAVGDIEMARALGMAGGHTRPQVHLDIDTGMGRSGTPPEGAVALWRACADRGLSVTGLCTHMADADGDNSELTELQWSRFLQARGELEAQDARFEWIHASNSAATLRYPSHGCNLVRPGLLLYGIAPALPPEASDRPGAVPLRAGEEGAPTVDPSRRRGLSDDTHTRQAGEQRDPPAGTIVARVASRIRPVLALRARVGSVRELPAGHTVSYGGACRLARPSRVATVLIGYGDGYPRRLSGIGAMLIRGRRVPILGRVCMDQTVVDVTDLPQAESGDIATCIGTDGGEMIAAVDLARQIETTEHEITTCLTSRLPRLHLNE